MGSVVYYVDFENVHFEGIRGIEELDEEDLVLIYCREDDVNRIKNHIGKTKASVRCRIVSGVSKNALDFELITDLFMSKKEGLKFIISKDKGFDAAINEGKRNNVLCFRKTSIKGSRFETFLEFYGEKSKEYVLC